MLIVKFSYIIILFIFNLVCGNILPLNIIAKSAHLINVWKGETELDGIIFKRFISIEDTFIGLAPHQLEIHLGDHAAVYFRGTLYTNNEEDHFTFTKLHENELLIYACDPKVLKSDLEYCLKALSAAMYAMKSDLRKAITWIFEGDSEYCPESAALMFVILAQTDRKNIILEDLIINDDQVKIQPSERRRFDRFMSYEQLY